MTLAPDAPPVHFRDIDEAMALLRERGLRVSSARRLVLEALFEAKTPASAEQIAQRAKLDVASVYRNLETLERHGLARHVHLGHGPSLYMLADRLGREYLYCERCGAVRAGPPREFDPVRERVQELFGYKARFTHFPIVGVCASCAQETSRR
jgi:Fur family ferric uptake transcriptional regulator